jgi:hypothetical protein
VRHEQAKNAVFGRYVAAPLALALSGVSVGAPFVLDLGPATTGAYLSAGAFMLTAAVGLWAHSDPYAARRWFASWGSLAFVGWSAALVLGCIERGHVCAREPGGHLQMGLGIAGAGAFASMLLASSLVPQPSPTALQLQINGLNEQQRTARVIDFLEQRERAERLVGYLGLPWIVAMSGVMIGTAFEAPTPEARAYLAVTGGILLAFNLGVFLYEHLREPDSHKLRRGELP